jgi:hypothetical protein
MWTRLEDYKQGHYWYPDHFVPLIDNYVSPVKQQPIKSSSSPCIDSLDDFPPLPLPTSVSKKRRIQNTIRLQIRYHRPHHHHKRKTKLSIHFRSQTRPLKIQTNHLQTITQIRSRLQKIVVFQN